MDSFKTILVLLPCGSDWSNQLFAGVQKYARTANWHLQKVEYSALNKGGYRLYRSPAEFGQELNVAELLKFWNPDGCIASYSNLAHDLLSPANFKNCPVVFLDRLIPVGKLRAACVCSDDELIAKLAAKELLMTGYGDFAYVPYLIDYPWSRDRGKAFSKFVQMNGKRFHSFRYPDRRECPDSLIGMLSPWIRTLPKPCGVFAANDTIAEAVLLACSSNAITVPDEIAVVGVDDVVHLCENSRPTLSSVHRNLVNAGFIAAETLEELMEAKNGSVPSRTFAAGLVRRKSSCIVKGNDRRVAKAVEYIRCHACDGIGPRQVVREMGISRTLADQSFRTARGHTILDEIHAIRLGHVKDLLARDIAPSVIAGRCGYSSLVDLRRVFKARLGMTMREYVASLSPSGRGR